MAKEKKVEALVERLEEMALFMDVLGENDFKVRAFRKGADALRATEYSLSDVVSGKVKIAGVGEGLKSAIKEFLESGVIAAHGELSAKVPSAVLELMQIPGLGPKKAMLIHQELGIQSIGELEYACRENRLLVLKGFGEAIQKKILSSIEDLRERQGKSRIDEALKSIVAVESKLEKKLGKDVIVLRVGELGRFHEIVEHYELFLQAPQAKARAAAESLDWKGKPEGESQKVFSKKLESFSGELRTGMKLTIWSADAAPDAQLLQWLCSAPGVRREIEENPDRFDGWECSWLEAEWVGAERKPKTTTYRRAQDGHVRGVFHCHTNFSDGHDSLEAMVKAAEERGYEYIGISDHSQSAFYAQGLKAERILEQQKLIKELQKKHSIRIFQGIESDILADGALDYEPKILEALDFVVGSIHSRFQMDEIEMTKRLVKALKNPHITIWGHPTGRLLLGRKGYGLDWDQCLKAAAKNGVAIEINANPHRLDIDWRLGEKLEHAGLDVCINPDAHEVDGLDDTRFGEAMAEKAMLPRASILNLKSVDQMEKHLWQRKKARV